MANAPSDPLITVTLSNGLADRHRLPLAHVLSVLDEVRRMLVETGTDLQNNQGVPCPTGDFGLELVAGRGGLVFKTGSVQADIAITRDKRNGVLATQLIQQTLRDLSKHKFDTETDSRTNRKIVRRLNNIARIQDTDKFELKLAVKTSPAKKATEATFDSRAMEYVGSLAAPEFSEEGVTLFGKLFELADRDFEDEGGRDIAGELMRDNGERWRVRFKSRDKGVAAQAFGQQVMLTGTATYHRVASPKITVESIQIDEERDYEAAFDKLYGCERDLLNAPLEELLAEIH